MFPGGAQQPEGLMDLAGNVWEWQEHYADDDHDVLAVRGGAWSHTHNVARVSERDRDVPFSGHDLIGFRVVAAPGFPTPALPTAAQK